MTESASFYLSLTQSLCRQLPLLSGISLAPSPLFLSSTALSFVCSPNLVLVSAGIYAPTSWSLSLPHSISPFRLIYSCPFLIPSHLLSFLLQSLIFFFSGGCLASSLPPSQNNETAFILLSCFP